MVPLVSSGDKLEAINYILRASGELTIDSLDDMSPEAEDAEKYIDRAMASIQSEGWDFNKDYTYEASVTPVVVSPESSYLQEAEEPTHVVGTITGSGDPLFPDGDYRLSIETPEFGESKRYNFYDPFDSGARTSMQFTISHKDGSAYGEDPYWDCILRYATFGSTFFVTYQVLSNGDDSTIPTFNPSDALGGGGWDGAVPTVTNGGEVEEKIISHLLLTVFGSTDPDFPDGDYRLDPQPPKDTVPYIYKWSSGIKEIVVQYQRTNEWMWQLEYLLTDFTKSLVHQVPSGDPQTVPTFNVTNQTIAFGWVGDTPAATNTGFTYVRETVYVDPILVDHYVLPTNTISAVPSFNYERQKWIMRGNRMYNRIDNTYVLEAPFALDIVFLLEWEETPLNFRDWATYVALVQYLSDVAQDSVLANVALGYVADARRKAQGYHTRNGRFTANRHRSRA